MISRLGQDKDGREILKYLQEQKLATDFIQSDPKLNTGTVDVHLDESRTATYTINKPAAWDAIELRPEIIQAVGSSDALIFGSLALRSETSRKSLEALLQNSKFKIFDLNLRPPHFNLDEMVDFLKRADLIKLNDEELDELANHLGLAGATITNKMINLVNWLPSETILCVTKGAAGAQLLMKGVMYTNPGYQVKVADTVGAGDSFLATLSLLLLNKRPPQEALDRACAMGSLVASKQGAIPYISREEITLLMNEQ
jgi:fructokinase